MVGTMAESTTSKPFWGRRLLRLLERTAIGIGLLIVVVLTICLMTLSVGGLERLKDVGETAGASFRDFLHFLKSS